MRAHLCVRGDTNARAYQAELARNDLRLNTGMRKLQPPGLIQIGAADPYLERCARPSAVRKDGRELGSERRGFQGGGAVRRRTANQQRQHCSDKQVDVQRAH